MMSLIILQCLFYFGKATTVSHGKQYKLTVLEQEEYQHKYTHIAPEVISGRCRQSTYSDMFSVGGVFYRIIDFKVLKNKEIINNLSLLAGQCCVPQHTYQPSPKCVLTQFHQIQLSESVQ